MIHIKNEIFIKEFLEKNMKGEKEKMKKFCAVFGIFRNEYRFLPLWIKYYSNLFGMENLYILDHCSTDGSTKDLECNVEAFGKPEIRYSNRCRNDIYNMIIKKHVELLKEYEHVICVDADEFIFVTPKYENLKEYIEVKGDISACTGYEIIQQPDENDLDWDKPILNQRNKWIKLNTYNKKVIVSEKTNWSKGLHYLYGKEKNIIKQEIDEDLILCHLHRVDYKHCKEKYLLENNPRAKDIGFPLFTKKENFDNYFVDINYHITFGATTTKLTRIPKEFKNII